MNNMAGGKNEGHIHRVYHLFRVGLSVMAVISFCSLMYQGTAFAEHELGDGYYTLVDEDDNEIFHTAIVLLPGDVFINADNRAYKVASVEGGVAYGRFEEVVTLDDGTGDTAGGGVIPLLSGMIRGLAEALFARQGQAAGTVVLYNTHSDESYEPSSGSSSKDWGDVYKVAAAFEQALKKHGFDVVRSTDNHNPHDGGAYARSRRTLAQLLKKRPIAAFDVHRDAVPPEVYRTNVAGEEVTKVTLVVGQQNQTRGQNLRFAKQLKSATDSKAPNLIKGILWAQGNYNQDMLPRAALIEVGAHTNRLEEAERAVGIFASSVAPIISSAKPEGGLAPGSPGRSIAWLVGILILAVICYAVINARKRQKQ